MLRLSLCGKAILWFVRDEKLRLESWQNEAQRTVQVAESFNVLRITYCCVLYG
jgi:hypothetical protein